MREIGRSLPIELRSTNLPHPTMWTGDFSLVTTDSAKPLVPAGIKTQMTPEEIANDTIVRVRKRSSLRSHRGF